MAINFTLLEQFNGSDGGGQVLQNPTSLQFGPDGRLYVSEQDGTVNSFAVTVQTTNGQVTGVSVADHQVLKLADGLDVVKSIANHNDKPNTSGDFVGSTFSGVVDGADFNGETNDASNSRQVTGIIVTEEPQTGATVLYVSSSDPRIAQNGEKNLDTNSGVLTRVTQVLNGSGQPVTDGNGDFVWDAVDLVRGLPRSEENHATNGMLLTEGGSKLLLQVGGFTNNGAPSNFFSNTAEYALSGTVLEIDLAALDGLPVQSDADAGVATTGGTGPNNFSFVARDYIYDLPTLDDPNLANAPGNLSDAQAIAQGFFEDSDGMDLQGPFGGNDGLNMAILPADAPLRIYADGMRNAYDLAQRDNGQIFTIDNGGNDGLGGNPNLDGQGFATNDPVGGGDGDPEPLYLVEDGAYYGHPNPTRANQDGSLTVRNDSGQPDGATGTNFVGNLSSLVPDVVNIQNGFLIDPSKFTADSERLRQSGLRLDRDGADPNNLVSDGQGGTFGREPIATTGSSTNGVTIYDSGGQAFDGALDGAVIAVQFNGSVTAFNVNDAGTALAPIIQNGAVEDQDGVAPLVNVGGQPLDVVNGPNGLLFVARIGGSDISVLVPTDLQVGPNPDVDGDQILNINDAFSQDASNGAAVTLLPGLPPLVWDFDPNQDGNRPGPNGISAGLTGVAVNGVDDFETFFTTPNPDGTTPLDNVKFITAALGGTTQIEQVADGTMAGTANDGLFQFQTGVSISPNIDEFTVTWTISNPGTTIFDPSQQIGGYIGTGDQSNFVRIVARPDPDNSSPVAGELLVEVEENDVVVASSAIKIADLFAVDVTPDRLMNLKLTIDRAAQTATPTVEYVLDATGNVVDGTGNVFTQTGAPLDI
nr:hypothetical protein [Paracoccaceae bacterium]